MPYYYPIVRVCDFVNFESTKATERVRKRKQTHQTYDVGKLSIQTKNFLLMIAKKSMLCQQYFTTQQYIVFAMFIKGLRNFTKQSQVPFRLRFQKFKLPTTIFVFLV